MLTTYTEASVGELVIENPGRARVLEKHGIDYCCGGNQTLEAACRAARGVLEDHVEPPAFHCGSVNNPIRGMMHEHQDAGDALNEMRRLTNCFTPPADACPSYRALFHGLRDLEADLHLHIHKENNLLFPRASEIEASIGRD